MAIKTEEVEYSSNTSRILMIMYKVALSLKFLHFICLFLEIRVAFKKYKHIFIAEECRKHVYVRIFTYLDIIIITHIHSTYAIRYKREIVDKRLLKY